MTIETLTLYAVTLTLTLQILFVLDLVPCDLDLTMEILALTLEALTFLNQCTMSMNSCVIITNLLVFTVTVFFLFYLKAAYVFMSEGLLSGSLCSVSLCMHCYL